MNTCFKTYFKKEFYTKAIFNPINIILGFIFRILKINVYMLKYIVLAFIF